MKRFVTYLYEYERGVRGANVGFVRTDLRESCRMDVQVRGFGRFQGKCPVYLTVNDNGIVGVEAAQLLVTQGAGRCTIVCADNLLDGRYRVQDSQSITIRCGNGKFLSGALCASPSPEALCGGFRVREAEISAAALDAAEPAAAGAADEPPTFGTDAAAEIVKPQPTASAAPPADAPASYQKIEITDIRRLPKRNWNLCSNRFLVHGFFNYHYLVLKTMETNGEKKQFLGVPGVYEQPERMMALLFGFPEFECAETHVCSAQALSEADAGTFGYWMCPLN